MNYFFEIYVKYDSDVGQYVWVGWGTRKMCVERERDKERERRRFVLHNTWLVSRLEAGGDLTDRQTGQTGQRRETESRESKRKRNAVRKIPRGKHRKRKRVKREKLRPSDSMRENLGRRQRDENKPQTLL